MNKFHWRLAAAVILVTLALSGCGKGAALGPAAEKKEPPAGKEAQAGNNDKGENETVLQLSGDEIAAAGIMTAQLQEQEIRDQLIVTATIAANQDRYASIAPRVTGKVAKVTASLGDIVRPGQPLALVDSIEVGEAQSAYAQAATEAAVANAAAERAEKLNAEQIIPQKDYLRARADADKARAVLRAAAARLRVLGITDNKAPGSVGASVFAVSAPFQGTVVEKKAVLGELAEPAKPLFVIADMTTVWIETYLVEKDLAKVKVGAPASVSVAAYPNRLFLGKVTYVSSVMDKETRTVTARVEVPNQDGALKLGMFANAAITTGGGGTKALVLPEDAVVLIQGQPTAFVKTAEGFEPRPVELGDKLRGQVLIKNGIRAGETVVVKGAYALKAKMLKSQISSD